MDPALHFIGGQPTGVTSQESPQIVDEFNPHYNMKTIFVFPKMQISATYVTQTCLLPTVDFRVNLVTVVGLRCAFSKAKFWEKKKWCNLG